MTTTICLFTLNLSNYVNTALKWETKKTTDFGIDLGFFNSFESESYMSSYIGRFNYNYDEKYLLSLTTRRDGSSQLSANDRWGWFPSASAGWRLDREKFFPVDESTINLFKLRGIS